MKNFFYKHLFLSLIYLNFLGPLSLEATLLNKLEEGVGVLSVVRPNKSYLGTTAKVFLTIPEGYRYELLVASHTNRRKQLKLDLLKQAGVTFLDEVNGLKVQFTAYRFFNTAEGIHVLLILRASFL